MPGPQAAQGAQATPPRKPSQATDTPKAPAETQPIFRDWAAI